MFDVLKKKKKTIFTSIAARFQCRSNRHYHKLGYCKSLRFCGYFKASPAPAQKSNEGELKIERLVDVFVSQYK